ncbi:hypothetical protein H0H93_002594 [Arthromyces matolae]|nr:hypothetical protein H0H93_002594 [Arthromyces matolae]
MPLTLIRLTNFLLAALIAGQTLHFSLSVTEAAPTPVLTSLVARDLVIRDSGSTHSSVADSFISKCRFRRSNRESDHLPAHRDVDCTQSQIDSICGRDETQTPTSIQSQYSTFITFSQAKPRNEENVVNMLITNVNELEPLLPKDPTGSISHLQYAALQYYWSYFRWIGGRKEPISLTSTLKLVILISKGVRNIGNILKDTSLSPKAKERQNQYRNTYLQLLNDLRITPEKHLPLQGTEEYAERVMVSFDRISLLNTVEKREERFKQMEIEISALCKDLADPQSTEDVKTVANAYQLLYQKQVQRENEETSAARYLCSGRP